MISKRIVATTAMMATLLATVTITSGRATAAENTLQIASYLDVPVTNDGETFLDQTFSIHTDTGAVSLRGSPDGSGSLYVDDLLDITITHADGTSVARVYDFSHGCSGSIEPISEYDLSSLLEPGSNRVRIIFRDSCGFNEGNTDIFMKGDFTAEGGGTPPGTEICTPSGPGGPTDGWAYTAVITASEGLIVRNLRFGPRLVAQMISVPYIRPVGFALDSRGRPSIGHLTTSPDSRDPDLRTTLTGFSCDAADDAHHSGVSARYRITSQSTGLTFIVQQSYRFDPYRRSERCEATESINCVRFWPTVTWALLGAEPPRPNIGLNVVQRFQFDPDAVGSGAADLIADTFTAGNLGVDDLARNGHLRREDLRQVLFRGDTVYWENYHQTGRARVGLPGHPGPGGSPGCSECVHFHWSWFANLGNTKLALANITSCGTWRCWSDGKPQLLEGSQQDAIAGWVKWKAGEQQPANWRALTRGDRDIDRDRLVFYWDTETTASGSPSAGVSINGADYAYGDSYWPQLDNKRHGGNGSMFIVPARRLQAVRHIPNPFDRSEANVTPLYDAVTRSSGRPPRLPAGWVLPVKISLVDPTDQGPYYLRVRSTAGLLNPAPLYRANFGGAPWVLVYDDTLRRDGTDWRLADDVPLQRYNGRRGYMLALAVFAERPTAGNTSFQLNAAPDGDDGYRPATGTW